jgi:CRP/FNR family transcriptional regulator, anaerobic regulatory protein
MRAPSIAFARPDRDHRPPVSPSGRLVPSMQPCMTSGTLTAEPTLRALFLSQAVEKFAPPRAIFWEGDAAGHVFHVVDGCLELYRIVQDGRRAVLGFSYAGDLLGASFPSIYPFTAVAVTRVRLRRLTRRRFHELVDEDQDLRLQLLAEISGEMTAAQDQIMRLGRTGADERVVTFLLNIARRAGGDATASIEIEVPFGRLDIADYLGLTVETVSREISKLKRAGLISTLGPRRIVLRRLGTLHEIARMDADELREESASEPRAVATRSM